MQFLKSPQFIMLTIATGVVGLVVLAILLVGPPQLLAKSESPVESAPGISEKVQRHG